MLWLLAFADYFSGIRLRLMKPQNEGLSKRVFAGIKAQLEAEQKPRSPKDQKSIVRFARPDQIFFPNVYNNYLEDGGPPLGAFPGTNRRSSTGMINVTSTRMMDPYIG